MIGKSLASPVTNLAMKQSFPPFTKIALFLQTRLVDFHLTRIGWTAMKEKNG